MRTRTRWIGPLLAAAATLGMSIVGPGRTESQVRRSAGYAWDEPDWRFSHHDRPVKVVLLAGSIGAFRDRPYGRVLHEWCENAEIRNLSQVGQGAPQLVNRFTEQVLENPRVPVGARGVDLWLLFGGGLNSVGMPERTNRAVHRLITLAHRRHIRVVTMSLTPWGDESGEDDRWRGARAVRSLRSTRRVVGFALGRLSPLEALGDLRTQRSVAPDAPWDPSELADVTVDLYDSRLRNATAAPLPSSEARAQLERDPLWRRETAELTPAQREARLSADARVLSESPRWLLRPEYRSFDHIHPNREGHQVIAETVCPRLPASWGCRCPNTVAAR